MTTLLKKASRYLQESGGRMTGQRRLILETIESISGHPTAEEIYSRARERDPQLNLSTVYRTLRWLEEIELIGIRRFGEDRLQDRFDSYLPVEHQHFRCSKCGKIIEFNNPLIDAIKSEFERDHHTVIDRASLIFSGICEDCQINESLSKS